MSPRRLRLRERPGTLQVKHFHPFHGHETKKENDIFILTFNDGRVHFMFSLVDLRQCSHVLYSSSLCVFIC